MMKDIEWDTSKTTITGATIGGEYFVFSGNKVAKYNEESKSFEEVKHMEKLVYYILDGHKVVECHDEEKWQKWLRANKNNRIVAEETIGNISVITRFMMADSSLGVPPPAFLTEVLGWWLDDGEERCTTWEEAEQIHARTVAHVKKSLELEGFDIEAIKARLSAASLGPWRATKEDTIIGPDDKEILSSSEWVNIQPEDLTFMAKARKDIEDLLTEIERLKGDK